jgi:putative transposase
MRDIELFSTGAVYHVYNRGIEKRDIFLDDGDYRRFIKGLIEFNEAGERPKISLCNIPTPVLSDSPCVDLIAYSLMPNHFHLMLKQLTAGGISSFMQRVGLGYTNYFNKRYERAGRLFEGPYKIKRMENAIQKRHLSRYVHLNPLELVGFDYKRRAIPWERAKRFLEDYRWSSYRHYAGVELQEFVRPEEALKGVGGKEEYEDFLRAWVERDGQKLDEFDKIYD